MFRYLTWSQIPVKTSIWHTLRKKTKSLEPLAYERIAIVFQPTARASPAHTKTNRRSAHRLEALEIWFFFSMCAKWMSPSESDFMLNIQWHEEIFETSNLCFCAMTSQLFSSSTYPLWIQESFLYMNFLIFSKSGQTRSRKIQLKLYLFWQVKK